MRLVNEGRTPVGYERERVSPKIYTDRLELRVSEVELIGKKMKSVGKFCAEEVKLAGVGKTSLEFPMRLPSNKTGEFTDVELGARVKIELKYIRRSIPHPQTGSLVDVIKARIVR